MTTAEATRELEAAWRELAAARAKFESEPSDMNFEWVSRAHIHYDDVVAMAQEWAGPDGRDDDEEVWP